MSLQQQVNAALGAGVIGAGIGKSVGEKIKTEKAIQATEKLKQDQLAKEAAQKEAISKIQLSPEQIAEAQNQGISLSEMQEQIYYSDPQNLPTEVQEQRQKQAEEEYLKKESIEQLLGAYNSQKDQTVQDIKETNLTARKEIKNRFARRLEAKKGGKR